MACETCQDCSCDSITLPIAVGETGPQGPAGPAGADGAAGRNVLFSHLTDSTINSALMLDFPSKTYTLPSATFDDNGDILKLTAWFTTGKIYSGSLEVYFGTGSISIPSNVLAFYLNTGFVKVEVTFNKVNDTTLIAQFYKIQSDSGNGAELSDSITSYLKTGITVNDLTASTNIIKLRGMENAAGDLTCNLMTLELFKFNTP